MATLEERVARLERIEEDRQLDAALRAHAFGINLVQAELAEARGDIARVDGKVDEVRAEVADLRDEMRGGFADLNGKLDAILERLDRA